MKVFLTLCLLAALRLPASASLEFKQTRQDVHAPAEAKSVTADFPFTNRGSKAVTIDRHESSCGCMSVTIQNGKLTYEPGESGLIRAAFDMGTFSGDVDKSVVIYLDGDPAGKPSIVLTTRVHIPVLVVLEPKTLRWDLGGASEAKSVQITMKHSVPIRVTRVTSSSENFEHELKTLEEGARYALEIKPRNTDSPGLAIFRIETDCAIEKHRMQQAFAVISRPTPAQAAGK